METSPSRPHPLYRGILIFGALLIVVLLVARFIFPGRTTAPSTLGRINIVPPFALTERSGKTITNNDLFGHIWVADFVYTTCPGPCPLVTAGMAKVQDAVAHDPMVQLVTFTVDPQTDTPAVLAAYADKFDADKNRWWFLTGSEKSIYNLIRNGFFQPVEDNRGKPPEEGQFTVTHSTQLALVDANGTVRGFYDGVGPEGRADLLKAIKILEKESD
jgi:protein SCO1/2